MFWTILHYFLSNFILFYIILFFSINNIHERKKKILLFISCFEFFRFVMLYFVLPNVL